MSVLGTNCAAGMFPLGTKANPNNIEDADPLMTEQFAPRDEPIRTKDGILSARCHMCEQRTMIKERPPRKGFFVAHSESQQGPGVDRGQSHGKHGEPPRIRGRKQ